MQQISEHPHPCFYRCYDFLYVLYTFLSLGRKEGGEGVILQIQLTASTLKKYINPCGMFLGFRLSIDSALTRLASLFNS